MWKSKDSLNSLLQNYLAYLLSKIGIQMDKVESTLWKSTKFQDDSEFVGRRSKGQIQLEDELKKAKKRQAMLDNVGVFVATIIMVIMALTIVSIKVMYASISINQQFLAMKHCWKIVEILFISERFFISI